MGRGLRITSLGYIGVLRLELPVWGIWHVCRRGGVAKVHWHVIKHLEKFALRP